MRYPSVQLSVGVVNGTVSSTMVFVDVAELPDLSVCTTLMLRLPPFALPSQAAKFALLRSICQAPVLSTATVKGFLLCVTASTSRSVPP